MNDTAGDISTEEFSDVSQDKEELIIKKENEKIEQIQEYKNKLERLERDDLDELKRVSFRNYYHFFMSYLEMETSRFKSSSRAKNVDCFSTVLISLNSS